MSAESPRHARSGGGPLMVPSQPPSDRSLIDAVSGFINDVTLSSSSTVDPKDVIQWARFETADINEPTPEGDSDTDISPLLLILGYGSGVQVWLIPPNGEAQEVLSWRQGTVRVLRILPTPQHGDCFASKRPLIALCDSASPGPTFCSLSFISIRGGEQVKSIKFKNPILDVLAKKRSVVVSFSERFAVFDAGTLEDRMAITTCYPCPCPLGGSAPINPLALGDRWLAYADKKLNPSKRSSGGCEGEGVTSYTATVLHAAKSLSKGLRGLGETVAHSLAGGRGTSQSPSPPNADVQHPGSVTVLDIEGHDEYEVEDGEEPYDPIVAHFIAHSDAIIALKFDSSGTLLITADRRGHDFHVFRINPHPCGPSLASVHHLYILHRGDTTAKVQDIAISPESRWAAISTLRGTTHVFPLSPYGGACGVRTHTGPRVVNRLSRFHRSAGLPIHTATPPRAGSPITVGDGLSQGAWYPNPRLPPYPLPTTVAPLAQLRPTANIPTHTITRTSSGRQRLSSLSEDSSGVPLLARARFGPPPPSTPPLSGAPRSPPATASLYLMAANGCLVQLLLHPRPARCVTKEKICDDSPIELDVEPIAQWPLQRPPLASDLLAPLPPSNPLLQPMTCRRCADICISEEERWLSQVEIVTHAGPHRRLWMGPQFVFKTYNCTGSNSSLSEAETVEVETSASRSVARSNPVNMPAARPLVPVIVDSGSASSLEHSPSDSFRRKSLLAETGRAASVCDVQLKEDLAEAMKEDHGWPREEIRVERKPSPGVVRAVDPLGTVVIPMVAPDPVIDDPDLYTHTNSDEATFRPVVRAPAALSIHPEMVVRPLPRDTTIPVQNVFPRAKISPEDEPVPLKSDVVIPVALSYVQSTNWKLKHSTVAECQFDKNNCKNSVVFEPDKQEATDVAKNVNSDILVFKKIDIKDLNRDQDSDECERDVMHERGLVDIAKRESKETITLPKSNQATDDIHPMARVRIKKSPTPKPVVSDKNVSEASDKIIQLNEEVSESKGVKQQHKVKDKSATMRDVRQTEDVTGDKEFKAEKETRRRKGKGAKDKDSKNPEDIAQENQNSDVKFEIKELEKINVHKDIVKDLQKVKDNIEDLKQPKKKEEASDTLESTFIQRPNSYLRNLGDKKYKKTELRNDILGDVCPPPIDAYNELCLLDVSLNKVNKDIESASFDKNKSDIEKDKGDDCSKDVTVKIPRTKKSSCPKSKKVVEDCVKTEDQAWDLLLSEQDKSTAVTLVQSLDSNKNKDDIKPKSKRNRKKNLDEPDKEGENSFVEIHNIEENSQLLSEELVSISTPFENIESCSSNSNKLNKSRHCNVTLETKDYIDLKPEDNVIESELICIANTWDQCEVPTNSSKAFPQPDSVPKIEILKDFSCGNITEVQRSVEETIIEKTSTIIQEQPKSKKYKSLSPFPVCRKAIETEAKDVYVINTSEENFPEIQITRGSKIRKSPQLTERKIQEKELVTEKPALSWSSIAASKKIKNVDQTEKRVNKAENKSKSVEERSKTIEIVEEKTSSSVSLHDKLIELCKRTDIVVAECDAPTELSFFDEHHAVVQDLPPLEPLDFGFDDFNLEVMRDSLLDVDNKVTSPICKINIDDILSSIKETTSKAIESSMFNLVDLEKIPAKEEKGFSVVASHKITTQEVKVDDEADSEEKEVEVMEKSSDEDPSPVLSTDSDKEDKKNSGACSTLMPSAKQSVKAKKSRKKKK